jgi:hypothetical protein
VARRAVVQGEHALKPSEEVPSDLLAAFIYPVVAASRTTSGCESLEFALPHKLGDTCHSAPKVAAEGAARHIQNIGGLLLGRGRVEVGVVERPVGFRLARR